ncbi:hypothetical protein E4U38_001310 [Claviceps purpurea]|nr:hypothetical protein E4U38_001310 [Claviceps purpurea]
MDTSSPDSDTEGLSYQTIPTRRASPTVYQTDSDETHGTEPLQPRLPANMDLLRTRMKKRSVLGARLNLHLHTRPPRNTLGKLRTVKATISRKASDSKMAIFTASYSDYEPIQA